MLKKYRVKSDKDGCFLQKKKKRKKNQKKSKKGIDNRKVLWYTQQAVAESAAKRSLKIEQQEISTKQKQVRNTNLVDRVYILKKVKEAKIKQLERL